MASEWKPHSPSEKTGRNRIEQILGDSDSSGSGSDSSSSSSSSKSSSSKSTKKKQVKANTQKTYTNAKLVKPTTRYIKPQEYSISRAGIELYESDESLYQPYIPIGSVSGVGINVVEDDSIDSDNDEEDAIGYTLKMGPITKIKHIGGLESVTFEQDYKDMSDSGTIVLDSVDLKKSYKGVHVKLLTNWDSMDNKLTWDDLDTALEGFITEQTFSQDNVEVQLSGMTKTLDMKYNFDFKQMLRSEIINQVILTAGLKPVINIKGLDDDITDFTNVSEGGGSSSSTMTGSTGSDDIDKAVKKAVKNLTDPLAKAKAIDKAFKSHIVYSRYSNVKYPELDVAWNKNHLNCADGANILCAMFVSAGLKANIRHIDKSTTGRGVGHYIVRVIIGGKEYFTDNASCGGCHTKNPFGKVWLGKTTGSDVGTKIGA